MTLPKTSCRSTFSGNSQENTSSWQEKVDGFVSGLKDRDLADEVSECALNSLRELPAKLGGDLVYPTSISIDDEGLILEFNFGVGERIFIEIEPEGDMTFSLLEEGKVTHTSELLV